MAGQGLPGGLAQGVEQLSGVSMGDVRVHYNSRAPAQQGALAYTQGSNIHLAPGAERQLPHEVWHVVQQKQGGVTPSLGVAAPGFEQQEAQRFAARAANMAKLQL
ncbi:MAG TPA: DUF4157 domain-containing protein [Caulobacteraceae bacterium]|nr:DUF4157 domain-containing protein [Caulobacteraceae bacterium]